MDAVQELERRIVELEIQSALQEDVIAGLNAMVAELRQTLDLQQAQLRLLYQKCRTGIPTRKSRIPCATRFRRIIDAPPYPDFLKKGCV